MRSTRRTSLPLLRAKPRTLTTRLGSTSNCPAHKLNAVQIATADKKHAVALAGNSNAALVLNGSDSTHKLDLAAAALALANNTEDPKLLFQQKETIARTAYTLQTALNAKTRSLRLDNNARQEAASDADSQRDDLDAAYATSEEADWSAETAADENGKLATAIADIAWTTAQESANISAAHAIDDGLATDTSDGHHLPWGQFLVAQMTAHADWWQSVKDNYKQWIIDENSNESAWQLQVNTGHAVESTTERTARHDLAVASAVDTQAADDGLALTVFTEITDSLTPAAKLYADTLAQASHDYAIGLAQAAYDGVLNDDPDLEETESATAEADYIAAGVQAHVYYASASAIAASARITNEAQLAKGFIDDLALRTENTEIATASAEDTYDSALARSNAALATADAHLDNSYWTARAASLEAMAQSLASSLASPFAKYYAAVVDAYSSLTADTDGAEEIREIAVADADAGTDAAGNATGGGDIGLADQQRDAETQAAQQAYNGVEQAAATAQQEAASEAAAAAAGAQPVNYPLLEPATLQAMAAQAYQHADLSAQAGFLPIDSPASVEGNPAPRVSTNPSLITGDNLKPTSPIKVEDTRNFLQEKFEQDSAGNQILVLPGLSGQPVPSIGTAPVTGLPDDFKVDMNWTAEEIAREAVALALGGAHGPMTTAQVIQAERYKDLIQRQQAYLRNQYYNEGHHRNAMIEALNKFFDPYANRPRTQMYLESRDGITRAIAVPLPGEPRPNYSSWSYERLTEELRKHLPSGTDPESWLDRKIAQDGLKMLEGFFGPIHDQEDQQRAVLDLIQFGMDAGGILDPTPISDGASVTMSVFRFDATGAAVGVVAMLPIFGDAAKVLKIPHYIETLRAVVRLAVRHPEVARIAQPVLKGIKTVFEAFPWQKIPPEYAERWSKLYDEIVQALAHVDQTVPKNADQLQPSWAPTPGIIGQFTQRGTPWGRTVWQRGDIDWSLRRKDGMTNLQAAKRGLAPVRRVDDGFEKVQLHHLNQDPSGGLAEVWKSTHGEINHNVPPPSWRQLDPNADSAFDDERRRYWIWRATQLGG
jgi:hypothetical protein